MRAANAAPAVNAALNVLLYKVYLFNNCNAVCEVDRLQYFLFIIYSYTFSSYFNFNFLSYYPVDMLRIDHYY